ncbi:TetR family transcriptional regulator [Aurantimonas aggregata]|uniref:TetR family transcriptional regulator n=1 Tax=Aurantimonas aggregata TaxID=2047720 RepID=UPI0031B5D30D
MRRTKDDALLTREAILDAAEARFYDHGVASTTLSHIATAAGLTRGAIYWHFPNKLELFRAMHERAKLPQEAFFSSATPAARRSLEELYTNSIEAFRHLERDERARKVLTILLLRCEYVGEMQDAMMRRTDADNAMHRTVAAIFAAVQHRGELKPEWQPEIAATAYVCAVGGVISEWLRSERGFDLVTVGGGVVRSVIIGFACPGVPIACLEEKSLAAEAARGCTGGPAGGR